MFKASSFSQPPLGFNNEAKPAKELTGSEREGPALLSPKSARHFKGVSD